MNKPEKVLCIDIETQSAVSIKNILEYVNHPSTRILCAVGKLPDEKPLVWIPSGRAPNGSDIPTCNLPPFPLDVPWVAHNAYGFDKLIWNRLYPDYKPARWIDTIPLCRANRLPAALEKVSQLLFGEGKNPQGKTVIEAMCTARYVNGILRYNVGTPSLWRKLIDYNIQDVLLLERLWGAVSPHFHEWDLLELDQRINERGIRFDRKLLWDMLRLWNSTQHDEFAYIQELTEGKLSGTDLRSPAKVSRYIESRGIHLSTLNKLNIEEELSEYDEIDPIVLEVLRARQVVSRGSKGKVERLLDLASVTQTDRLRHSLVFHGGHTGRWSGRGVQPQNLARPVDPERLHRILEHYDSTGELTIPTDVDTVLSELARPVFIAEEGKTLLIGDYSAIEGRGLAWIAGEETLLAAFADDTRDVYCEMASRIFGRTVTKKDKLERQVGKVVVLASGYQMSGAKLDLYCKLAKPKVDLAKLGLDPKEVIKGYRDSVPAITHFWRTSEMACIDAVKGKYVIYGENKLAYYMRENNLCIRLPSGRELIYRNARVEDVVPVYVALYNLPIHTKPTVMYDHPHGYRKGLYGGLITENIVQAICRDILADALLRCERQEFKVVMHVHDEIVCEAENGSTYNAESLTRLMTMRPSWAMSFPLKVEVHSSKRYDK